MSAARNVLDIKKIEHKKTRTRVRQPQPVSASTKTPQSRPKRLRDKRRRQRIVAVCIYVLGFMGIIGGLGAASHLDQLSVQEISVTGAQSLSADVLKSAAESEIQGRVFGIFSRESMFLYPRHRIETALAQSFPRIRDVSVSRPALMAQAVVVTVEERVPFATWCADVCYVLDHSGFIFADNSAASPQSSYEFRGGLVPGASPIGQYFLRGRLSGVLSFLEILQREGFNPAGVTVMSERDFLVPLREGASLIVPFGSDPARIVYNLNTALQADALRGSLAELDYIDLRFGNRVYYKSSIEE